MPRPLLVLLVFSLCSANLYGQQAKAPLPAVKRILDKAVADVKKNRKEFDEANEKPLDEARAELQDLSTQLIKDGKTDEATAVLAHVKTLEADVMKMANAPAPAPFWAVPQKPLLERLAGKWTHSNSPSTMTFLDDGKAQDVKKDDGVTTDGSVRPLSPDEAEVRWASGWKSHIRLIDADTIGLRFYRPEGREHGSGAVWLRMK